MAAIPRSVSRALVLNSHKASEFLNKKVNTSADAIKRFLAIINDWITIFTTN